MQRLAAPRATAADTPSSAPSAPSAASAAPLPRHVPWLWSAAVALGLAVAGCGGGGGDAAPATSTPAGGGGSGSGGEVVVTPAPDPVANPRVVAFRNGLDHPWGLAFLTDGRMLVTERDLRQLRLVSADGATLSAPIRDGLPAIYAAGQAGLLDVVLDPDFAANRRIYLSYVEGDSAANGLAVWRAEVAEDFGGLRNGTRLWRASRPPEGGGNYGGRLLFDGDKRLFVSVGDRLATTVRGQAQNPGSPLGKILRITTDGAPAPGNPAIGGGVPGLWSLGHRNPQGLALNPASGQLWEAEHGPQGGDEINVVGAGANYGWPLVSFGCEYGEAAETCQWAGGSGKDNLAAPLTHWTPSVAPGGIAFYTGDKFPEWRGNLFVTALAYKSLWRLTLDGNTVTGREELFASQGKRLRAVYQGPDGWLYLLTDEAEGQILRVQR